MPPRIDYTRQEAATAFPLPFPEDFQQIRFLRANEQGLFVSLEGGSAQGAWVLPHEAIESRDEATIEGAWAKASGTRMSFLDVDGAMHGFTGGNQGLRHYVFDGSTFEVVAEAAAPLDAAAKPIVEDIARWQGQTYLAVRRPEGEPALVRVADGFEVVPTPGVAGVSAVGSNGTSLYVGTEAGTLFRTDDGATFTPVDVGMAGNAFVAWSGETNDWAPTPVEKIVANGDGLLRVHVDPSSWEGVVFEEAEAGVWRRTLAATGWGNARKHDYDPDGDAFYSTTSTRTYRTIGNRQWELASSALESWTERLGEDGDDAAIAFHRLESGDERAYVGFSKAQEGRHRLWGLELHEGAVPSTDLDHALEKASYLGTGGDDGLTGVVARPDGRLVLFGRLADASALGVPVDGSVGAGPGALLWLDATMTPESVTTLPSPVLDGDAGDGTLSVVTSGGLYNFDLETGTLRFSVADDGNDQARRRVDVGNEGRSAWQVGGRVRVVGADGEVVADRAGWARPPCIDPNNPAQDLCYSSDAEGASIMDVVMDDDHDLVVVAGHRAEGLRWDLPVIVAFVDAYDVSSPDMSLAWWNWGQSGSTLTGGQAADTQAELLVHGDDGHYYFFADIAGGNSIMNHDPRSPTMLEEVDGELRPIYQPQPTFRLSHDLFSSGSSGATHVSYVARLEGGTGIIDRATQINTVRRPGGGDGGLLGPCWSNSMAADAVGRLYVALGCRWLSQGRDAVRVQGRWPGDPGTVDPDDGKNKSSGTESYVVVLTPDFASRQHWAPLAMPGDDVDGDGFVEPLNAQGREGAPITALLPVDGGVAITSRAASGTFWSVDPWQDGPEAGRSEEQADGWFGVLRVNNWPTTD